VEHISRKGRREFDDGIKNKGKRNEGTKLKGSENYTAEAFRGTRLVYSGL